jgi:choline-glycine betaine transporter
MFTPKRLRMVIIALIVVIMCCVTASAILGLRTGHTARAASTFFAGLAFSILFWTRLTKKVD